MEDTTEPVAPETTATEVVDAELVDGQVAVGDDHDHAEGRGLPVVRTVGDVGAGWGLVPSGAIVLVRTLAEMTAWGAGWTQETTLAGLLPIGVGTTFSQTFAEATSYGTAWLHSHSDDHQHAGGSHTHGMQSHSHDLQSHTHDLQSHTHSGGSHTHGMGHTHTLGSGGSSFLAALGGGAGSTNVSTDTHTHGGNTGSSSADPTGTPSASTSGTPSNNTSQGPSNNTSTGPSNNTTDAGNSTTSTGLKTSGTTTADATWLPPMRGMIYARKV